MKAERRFILPIGREPNSVWRIPDAEILQTFSSNRKFDEAQAIG